MTNFTSDLVSLWKDMDTDSVAGRNISLFNGAYNNGPGADLGLYCDGVNDYAEVSGFKYSAAQGTAIFRVKFPSGCSGGQSPWYQGDINSSVISMAYQGTYFIVNGNFCSVRNNLSNTWQTLVGTWGAGGIRGYENTALRGINSYTGSAPTPYYDMTFGALHYNGGYVQNINCLIDFAAILSRQISVAEVAEITANPTILWAPPATTQFTKKVAVGTDDARFSSNSTYQDGTQFPLGQFSGVIGNMVCRFTGVTIPQGATITKATLSASVVGATSATAVNYITRVGNEANAAMPTTYSACTSAAKTTGTSGSNIFVASSGYNAFDCTAEVQALVNRSDWASGNAMTVYLMDNGSASGAYATIEMYDQSAGVKAPVIDITYTVPNVMSERNVPRGVLRGVCRGMN